MPETQRCVVDLSHRIRAGLVTYPGLPAPVITPHLTREDSRGHYEPGTEGGFNWSSQHLDRGGVRKW
ncbi:MAG: hypothetical protein EAS51_01655, partial [Microbacteriaceae bacterium]